jgi:hypothetical protein
MPARPGPAGEISHRRGQLPRHRRALRAGRGVAAGQQLLDAVRRDRQRLGQAGPQPRQRRGLAAFPAHHRGALHPQPLGQLFLGQTHRLAALGQTPPPGRLVCCGAVRHCSIPPSERAVDSPFFSIRPGAAAASPASNRRRLTQAISSRPAFLHQSRSGQRRTATGSIQAESPGRAAPANAPAPWSGSRATTGSPAPVPAAVTTLAGTAHAKPAVPAGRPPDPRQRLSPAQSPRASPATYDPAAGCRHLNRLQKVIRKTGGGHVLAPAKVAQAVTADATFACHSCAGAVSLSVLR